MHLQASQLGFDFPVTPGQLRADEIKHGGRLLKCKQVSGAPVALQAFGNLVLAGADAHVFHRSQYLSLSLASNDGAQNFLPCFSYGAGDDAGELDIHLRKRFLHVLHITPLGFQEHSSLTPQ